MSLNIFSQLLAFLFILLFNSSFGHDPWMTEFFRRSKNEISSQLRTTETFAEQWFEEGLLDLGFTDAPQEEAKVTFGETELKSIGEILRPSQTKAAPRVNWSAEDNKLYTILMMDLDAPSRANPIYSEWFHWGVINVPRNDVNKGEVITEYMGPTPPKGTGLHRYVVMVFQQPAKITYKGKKIGLTGEGRANNHAKDIADEYDLGEPIAGASFEAEWEA